MLCQATKILFRIVIFYVTKSFSMPSIYLYFQKLSDSINFLKNCKNWFITENKRLKDTRKCSSHLLFIEIFPLADCSKPKFRRFRLYKNCHSFYSRLPFTVSGEIAPSQVKCYLRLTIKLPISSFFMKFE